MALLGSDFVSSSPADTDSVSNGAAAIRDIKTRLKAFCSVLFDLETGRFISPQTQITVSATAPTDPSIGDMYYDLTTEAAYVYLSSGWTLLVKPSLAVGTMIAWSGTAASITSSFAGLGGTWVHADGSAISRTTYADYFALIGTTRGAGDGTTTFNIPDTRNLFIVGANSDSAGEAMTNVTDGSTLSKTRGYTSHIHSMTLGGPTVGGGGIGSCPNLTDPNTTRDIPPFMAMPYVVRIK